MLNQYPAAGAVPQEKEKALCRPDPEEMLQKMRVIRERIENDIESFKDMDNYYFPGSEKFILMMFGAMHVKLHEIKKEEQYWLKEIDKN